MLANDNTLLGLGDGGAHYGLICDASVPTFMLTYWTRDRRRGTRFSIAEMVRKLTSRNAAAVGLTDRGVVARGYKANINIIDYDRLALHAPRMSADLPGGGSRLSQTASGYVATLVNGQVTYREGAPTGALPGRLVRAPRSRENP
jgi:N-acyl-D-aspartate/D-glutamate deacylase